VAPQQRNFDLQHEVEQVIRPVIELLKDATEESRRTTDLRSRREFLIERLATAESAMRTVERTRDALPADSPARAETERELEERWRPSVAELNSERLVVEAQIKSIEEGQASFVEGATKGLQKFLRSSGINLLMSLMAFAAVFFGLRYGMSWLWRERRSTRRVTMRVLELVTQLVSLLLAIGAAMMVPYAREDFLLLAVYLLFLVGAGWMLVKTLPQFFEQVRLVLNVGAVREGERILVDGLPYRVESLRLYSRLRNPDLEGGNLRVPIRDLIGQRSRRSAPDEPWFPCRTGDVVLLADGTFGPVRTQTPQVVVVEQYSSPRTYPTGDFLEQQPRNLSAGFVVATTCGIDYGHQAEAVAEIPKVLKAVLQEGLAAAVDDGALQEVRVELAAAGASSLDLLLRARFTGAAARSYLDLQRLMQSLFVATCTKNDWLIPFPQLTLHRGEDRLEEPGDPM
jgi:hypothetical protein